MAVDRTKATLSIALIVFVMLSFVLGITTYVFSSSQAREAGRADETGAELAELKRRLEAEAGEKDRLRDVIGTAEDTVDSIEAERTTLFETSFAGYPDDQKTYSGLVAWLGKAITGKDADLARVEQDKAALAAEKDKAVAAAEAARQAAEQAQAKAEETLKQEQEDFKKRRVEAEQKMEELSGLHKQALATADQMRAITEEIEKLGVLLGPDLRRKFAAPAAEGQPEPWPERVRFARRELEERQRQIRDLNETLGRLRVADDKLQRLVRDATPADDRIDGFDGRIVAVNAADSTALVLCPTTAGLRPGLVLFAYDPADPRPEFGARKATLQVVEVESPTLARARILRDTVANPLLSGDGVATSLWSPGEGAEVVIVGFVRLGDDPTGELGALRERIERAGARVVDAVSSRTTIVVDAGPPDTSDINAGTARSWRAADENRRKKAIERAQELGLRVTGLAGLLEMLGLDVPTAGAGQRP
jgi:hypothetical protein